jgi:hypothetical protein
MFFDNEGLGRDWWVARGLSRREGYGERAISRTTMQRDRKKSIVIEVRPRDEYGPFPP